MTEDEARGWFAGRDVPRETCSKLAAFADFLKAEAQKQNLVAASTLDALWSRHFVDSAQLLDLAPPTGDWLDLGSGPGFPGLIVAVVGQRPVTLVESRAKRVAFLREAALLLGVEERVEIVGTRLEIIPSRAFAVISARAFAPLPRLLELAHRFSTAETRWLLPKGRGAQRELEEIAASWQGAFQVVPSVTDPDAAILVASDIRPGKAP